MSEKELLQTAVTRARRHTAPHLSDEQLLLASLLSSYRDAPDLVELAFPRRDVRLFLKPALASLRLNAAEFGAIALIASAASWAYRAGSMSKLPTSS